MSLEYDILPINATGKRNALAWHYNLQDIMLGTSCDYNYPWVLILKGTHKACIQSGICKVGILTLLKLFDSLV